MSMLRSPLDGLSFDQMSEQSARLYQCARASRGPAATDWRQLPLL